MQNEPPEKYASSTQSSPVSAVIPQLGSAAVSLHVMLKRAPEGWKMALPSRPPTRFPRLRANSIPPRAPRRARIHAWYVGNIQIFILHLLQRQRETAAVLDARAAARCLSGSQCLPKREGHASSQTATSKFLPATFRALRSCRASSSASTFHSEHSPAVIQPANASRTWRTRRRAAEISPQHPPSTPRSAPGIQHIRVSFDGTFVYIAHTRLPQATRAIQRRARQILYAGNLPRFRNSISTRGSCSGARRLRARTLLLRLERLMDAGAGI